MTLKGPCNLPTLTSESQQHLAIWYLQKTKKLSGKKCQLLQRNESNHSRLCNFFLIDVTRWEWKKRRNLWREFLPNFLGFFPIHISKYTKCDNSLNKTILIQYIFMFPNRLQVSKEHEKLLYMVIFYHWPLHVFNFEIFLLFL